MTYETILYEAADGIVTITLNRPEVHNAMNERMRQELTRCFGDLATSDEARVVVVTGAGERAFSAGADIREFVEPQVPIRFRESRKRVDFRQAMDRCPQPIIGAIRGYAWAAGSSWRLPAISGSRGRTRSSASPRSTSRSFPEAAAPRGSRAWSAAAEPSR